MRLALSVACLCCTLLRATPTIFTAQDPVAPDETCVVTGADLPASPVRVARVADGPPGEPGRGELVTGPWATAQVLAREPGGLRFVVPAALTPGQFAWQIAAGRVGVLNAPRPWWLQGDLGRDASPGGWLRICGKNLRGATPSVALRNARGTTLRLACADRQSSAWALQVPLPADLAPGTWRAYVHNGWGGAAGWSAPLELRVSLPASWPTKVYDVRDFGADGRGERDDTAALQAALDKAGAEGGGVVSLPRGRYKLTAGLTLPRFVVLRGAATDQVALCWPELDPPPPALLRGTNSFAVENLTLYASRHRHGIVGDLGDVPGAGHVRLWRVRLRLDTYRGHLTNEQVDQRLRETERQFGGDSVQLGGADLAIGDCDIYGSGRALYLSRVRGGRVHHNRFYNGRWGWYCLSGCDGLLFEDNQIQGADLMSTGGGLNCLDGSSYAQHVLFARNRLSLLHGWDREALTSDAGGGLYYGPVAACRGTLLRLPRAPAAGGRDWRGAGVFILAGRGAGQYRRVAAVDGDTVTLDTPFAVDPDATSRLGVTMLQRRYLLVDNSFADAGVAIQFYGCSVEHIVAGNRSVRTGGYQAIGKAYGGYKLPPDENPCHQPSWYCQFLDNEVADGAVYRGGANGATLSGEAVIGVFGWALTGTWPWPYNRGAVVRGNRLLGQAHLAVGGSGNALPTVSDVVVEHNEVRDSEVGVQVDRATAGIVVRRNRFERVTRPLAGDGAAALTLDEEQQRACDLCALQSVATAAGLSEPSTWPGLSTATSREQRLRVALRELTAQRRRLPLTLVAPLFGLDVAVSAPELTRLLQRGGGGPSTLGVTVRAAQVPPGVQVRAAVGRWLSAMSAVQPLSAGQPVALTVALDVPPTAWGPVELPVVLGLDGLELSTSETVGSGYVTDWLAVGPFPNRSGTALDLGLWPPDDHADVAQTYPLDGRTLAWRAVAGTPELDLAQTLGSPAAATAYLATVLTARAATAARLRLGTSGGYALTLNGSQVATRDTARAFAREQDTVTLNLEPGDNVLQLKLSTTAGPWKLCAELLPVGPTLAGVLPAPAAGLAERPILHPPARPVPATGAPSHTAGVDWQLVYADDFDGAGLGPRWRPALGTFTVAGGALKASGGQAFVAYAEALTAPVRVEYDTRAVGATGGDQSAFWLSDPKLYQTGLLWGFGSNGNSACKLLVDGTEAALVGRPLVVPGRWQHVIAQVRADGQAQLIVDDQLALDVRTAPPTGARFPGLWSWGNEALFARVRIYQGR